MTVALLRREVQLRVRIKVMEREFNRVGEEGPDDDRTADSPVTAP